MISGQWVDGQWVDGKSLFVIKNVKVNHDIPLMINIPRNK